MLDAGSTCRLRKQEIFTLNIKREYIVPLSW